MTKYLNRVRIDTHSQFEDHMTEVVDLQSETPIVNFERIDITIQPMEPVIATFHLVHIEKQETAEGMHVFAMREDAHCPDVDLLPLVALVKQASSGKYYIDGNSWEYLPDGSLAVVFKKIETL